MESTSLLHSEAETPPAPPGGRSLRVAGVVVILCSTVGVIAGMSQRHTTTTATPTASSPKSELYSKKDLYGPGYGSLVGDDRIQKAWPGLTCDRSDDDKWGWAEEPMAQPLDSGTNCVYGDTNFCMKHTIKYDGGTKKFDGLMYQVSELMWNRCNASCNATDERHIANGGLNAKLVGTSSLAACQFQGIVDMQEVCTGVPDKFKIESRRRYLAVKDTAKENRRLMNNNPPSVPERWMANVVINQSYSQDPCNTHALCGICLDDDGNLDSYCEAFLYYYSIKYTETYNAALFWYNVHFWCMDEVLDAIEDGTFIDKVESGEIPNNDEIETAWNNHQAIEKFGTWHVPTDDNYTWDYKVR